MAQGVLATNLKQYDDLDKAKVFKLLMSEYIMAATDPDSLFKQTLQAVDDINFIGPTMKELDWAAPRGGGLPTDRPTFLYQFDYRDSGEIPRTRNQEKTSNHGVVQQKPDIEE